MLMLNENPAHLIRAGAAVPNILALSVSRRTTQERHALSYTRLHTTSRPASALHSCMSMRAHPVTFIQHKKSCFCALALSSSWWSFAFFLLLFIPLSCCCCCCCCFIWFFQGSHRCWPVWVTPWIQGYNSADNKRLLLLLLLPAFNRLSLFPEIGVHTHTVTLIHAYMHVNSAHVELYFSLFFFILLFNFIVGHPPCWAFIFVIHHCIER